MTLQRVSSRSKPEIDLQRPLTLGEWLDDLQRERDWLYMRLRQVEKPLVEHGWLKVSNSLERRVR